MMVVQTAVKTAAQLAGLKAVPRAVSMADQLDNLRA